MEEHGVVVPCHDVCKAVRPSGWVSHNAYQQSEVRENENPARTAGVRREHFLTVCASAALRWPESWSTVFIDYIVLQLYGVGTGVLTKSAACAMDNHGGKCTAVRRYRRVLWTFNFAGGQLVTLSGA